MTFHAVQWTPLELGTPESVQVGDLVSADAGGMPIYKVMGFDAGRVMLAGDTSPAPRHMPLELFRWKARDAA